MRVTPAVFSGSSGTALELNLSSVNISESVVPKVATGLRVSPRAAFSVKRLCETGGIFFPPKWRLLPSPFCPADGQQYRRGLYSCLGIA